MATRGWMGGVSRREILSIKPETFFCAVFETSLKVPRSLSRKCVQVYITVEGCQGAHSSSAAVLPCSLYATSKKLLPESCLFAGTFDERSNSLRSLPNPSAKVAHSSIQLEVATCGTLIDILLSKFPTS